ncbi:MAG: excinuclease ABC subunit UvrC [Kiritimatiellia bacterium]
MQIPQRIRDILKELPAKPGCYIMRDITGTIIYVGKAVDLRKRVQSYFRQAALKKGDPKLRSLVKSVADLEYMVVHNEAAAILTEGDLIKKYRPRYNILLKDDKRFLLIRADRKVTFPRFETVRIRRNDGAQYFGPYVSSLAARATIDFLEKHFGLRKCTPAEPDATTYRHCHNDIIRLCSAPCVNRISAEAYRERFEEACAFLRGRRPQLLAQIRTQMQQAAQTLDFEQAAALRDSLLLIEKAVRQHARVAPTPRMQHETAKQGIEALAQLLDLPAIPHVIETFDISNIMGTYAVASMVCAVEGIPAPNRYRRFRIKTVVGANDPAMMAEAVRRRIRGLQEDNKPLPGLILVDGGITQLKATHQVLIERGVPDLPLASLAKRHEEIYYRADAPPLRLERHNPALKVLQRIRDEAHRFAITYHRNLRNRRLRESALDKIPGIGEKRKELLLNTLGSVQRIAKASIDEIAAVPGIGPTMAQTIHSKLNQ